MPQAEPSAKLPSFLPHAEEVSWYGTLEGVGRGIGHMVVHYVEHYPYSGFVQGLDHFLEFPDAARRIVGVSGVGAVGNIVVHRVVAPVVDIVLQPGLVH